MIEMVQSLELRGTSFLSFFLLFLVTLCLLGTVKSCMEQNVIKKSFCICVSLASLLKLHALRALCTYLALCLTRSFAKVTLHLFAFVMLCLSVYMLTCLVSLTFMFLCAYVRLSCTCVCAYQTLPLKFVRASVSFLFTFKKTHELCPKI